MMILDRYLGLKVLSRLLLVAFVFAAVFAAYTMAVYLSQAAAGLLKPGFVLRIVGMKAIIATEVILPVALYVAVVMAIARLRQSEETTAMLAGGFGRRDAGYGLLPLFAFVAVIVAVVSLWVRPETYTALYQLRSRAEAAFDFSGIEPGRFYTGSDGNRVVYVGNTDGGRMERVFIWNRKDDEDLIIRAKRLERSDADDARALLDVNDVRIYRRDEDGWRLQGEAGSLETTVDFGGLAPIGYKRKAASTQTLAKSHHPEDIAEFQWRVSRPLSAFLLGFLALRVAGFAAGIRRRLFSAVLIISVCLVYNLVSLTARSWVIDGFVPPFPGLFWVDAALLIYLAYPLLLPTTKRRKTR